MGLQYIQDTEDQKWAFTLRALIHGLMLSTKKERTWIYKEPTRFILKIDRFKLWKYVTQ